MLQGDLIELAPLSPMDAGPLFRWLNDVDAAFLDLAYRPIDGMSFQTWFQGLANDPTKVLFAIRKRGAAPLVGYVQIRGIDPVHHNAEIGLRIGEEEDRGLGYGSEALRLVQRYCWDTLNLHRLGLGVFSTNQRAIRAYAAAGFQQEGMLRDARFIGGEWKDLVLMAALRPKRVP